MSEEQEKKEALKEARRLAVDIYHRSEKDLTVLPKHLRELQKRLEDLVRNLDDEIDDVS